MDCRFGGIIAKVAGQIRVNPGTVANLPRAKTEIPVEMDEMWGFCHDKSQQVWLWWAVDHETNTPLAYVFGSREHRYLDELLKSLEPFSISTVYTDNNYAYKK